MKKITSTLVYLLLTVSAFATQISVSNSPQNPGQYSSIGAAITAAAAGDTLLVHPTSASYGNFTINKKLVIIGGGFNVQKTNPFYTTFGSITLAAGCDGSKFYGFRASHFIDVFQLNNLPLDSLFFEDLFLTNYIIFNYAHPTNMVVRNCIIDYSNLNNDVNSSVTFSHCIFEGSGPSNSNGSLLVEYCLFQGNSTSHLNSVSGAVVQNCIFYDGAISSSITLSTFNNCMSFNLSPNTLPPGTNIGSGNQSGVDPLFVNNPINAAFSYSLDYNLQAGSPALTAATDGGEIGIYGGPNPTFSLSGEPLNSPIIRDFTITNAAIPVNGNLDIDVTITKPISE